MPQMLTERTQNNDMTVMRYRSAQAILRQSSSIINCNFCFGRPVPSSLSAAAGAAATSWFGDETSCANACLILFFVGFVSASKRTRFAH